MPDIRCKFHGFPPGSGIQNTTHRQRLSSVLNVGKAELIAAAKRSGAVLTVSDVLKRSPSDLAWRDSICRFALVDSGTCWARASSHESLDGTEKAFHSYFIGQVMASLVSSRVFDFGFLLHYDSYLKNGSPQLNPKDIRGERPDLVGYDPQTEEFIIIEAKGYKTSITRPAQQIKGVSSNPSNYQKRVKYVITMASFSRAGWEVDVYDPCPPSFPLPSPAELIGLYYAQLVVNGGFLESQSARSSKSRVVLRDTGNDATISLPCEIVAITQRGLDASRNMTRNPSLLDEIGKELISFLDITPHLGMFENRYNRYIGVDGLEVRVNE